MQEKIKIAIMSEPMDRRPEKSFFAKRLVENLLKNSELEIYLVHYKKIYDEPLYNNEKIHEVLIPLLSLPWGSHFFSFIWFCFKTKERFDIVQWLVPRPYPFFWFFPAKKVIIIAHDGYIGIWTFANSIFWFTIRYFNKYISAIIGVSEYAKREIMKTYHIPASKVYAIYNGIDNGYEPISKNSARDVLKKYNITAEKYFIYVGGLVPHKNVARLILSYGLLRKNKPEIEEKLIIAGKASLGAEEIKDAVKTAGCPEDIIFLSHVPHEDLPSFYSLATALTHVSLSEGFGMPIAEAMACGAPVITSNISAMPEVAGGAAILVDPYDIEDIMRAMKKIVEDSDLRKELIKRGFERAKMFTWEKYAEENFEIYLKVLFFVKTSLADVIDRYTILKLKKEGIDDYLPAYMAEKEKPMLEVELALYEKVIKEFDENGIKVESDLIEKLYNANLEGREMESNIRRNMSKVSNMSPKDMEEVGRSVAKLRNVNDKRVSLKNEIMAKWPNATTKTIKPSLAEFVDRYTILKLKMERISGLSADQILHEQPILENEFAFYDQAIKKFSKRGINVDDKWIERLYYINGKIWDLESDIRRGKEELLGLEEVGRRSIKIREYANERIDVKNEISEKSKTGFKEVKVFIK